MPVLEIRRHAERADRPDNESALSPAGHAMAGALAKRAGRFALVVASPLPRAKETAQLIAGRLDAIEAGLLPDMGGIAGNQLYGELRTLADWSRLLREREDARRFALDQLRTWGALASRVGERDTILAISHGGIIELPALALTERLGQRLEGPTFGYCEGVRVNFAKGEPTKIVAVRL